ncbi:halovibrin HvnA [Pseudomonas sp. SWRI92]|uniref:halovibrin HvnA n=1 Tax=Pseudomonas sp. SWRI92 TaxID=2745499 RepID=UPI001644804B|nr:halovibrin HvnA [Pseudomonas sp. SWRI92]MBC3372889.1 halovibrin HvnA [Pseudomonas sp. SWRI92]
MKKKIGIWALLIALTGGAVEFASASDWRRSGGQVAVELNQRYNDLRDDCGSATRPSFLCSGVMLRAAKGGSNYFAWNPSPYSQGSGGVSFSFLRKDVKFQGLVYGQRSGYIFYPDLIRDPDTLHVKVLCAFPMDGATNNREKPGCGAYPFTDATQRHQSQRCQTLGITTAEQWVQNRDAHGAWCGFDVDNRTNNASARSFAETIRAHNLAGFFEGNYAYIELILATWPQLNNPASVPIEAFFYTEGGLEDAQRDQWAHYIQSGEMVVVPIIRLTLPATPSDDAVFSYIGIEQRILSGYP